MRGPSAGDRLHGARSTVRGAAPEQTWVDRAYVTAEVDRYTSTPGQALACMIGKLKIDELRQRAQARLGERFDLRSFHNAVIDNGAVPLDVLDRLMEEWIAGRA